MSAHDASRTLTDMTIEARRRGMTYGQYVSSLAASAPPSELPVLAPTPEQPDARSRHKRGPKPRPEGAPVERRLDPGEHQRRMEAYRRGLSDVDAARELGLSVTTISNWRYDFKLKANVRPGRPRKYEGR